MSMISHSAARRHRAKLSVRQVRLCGTSSGSHFVGSPNLRTFAPNEPSNGRTTNLMKMCILPAHPMRAIILLVTDLVPAVAERYPHRPDRRVDCFVVRADGRCRPCRMDRSGSPFRPSVHIQIPHALIASNRGQRRETTITGMAVSTTSNLAARSHLVPRESSVSPFFQRTGR